MKSKLFTKLWSASMWIAAWNSNKRQSQFFSASDTSQFLLNQQGFVHVFYELSSRSETLNSVSVVQDQINVFLKGKLVSYTGNWLWRCKCDEDIFASLRAMAWEYKEMCQNNFTASYYFHHKSCVYFLSLLSL